jgi:NADH-quinone oxidoreductase subunit G
MSDIEIEIDGQKLTAKSNQTVIEVADAAGIYIPRFCYHKHLTVAANCRMCLVEVEKSPKTLPACATPVMAGMKVFTQSAKTLAAQRSVMEFLLINHPLDCPVCDQGGECELQDLSMGYGSSHTDYDECKRAVADQDLGPLIATEMTRCILCTRCVRFGDEIAGLPELGVTNRGGAAEISTYVQHAIRSEVSGNIIDICPVGALTSKPYRFTARAWELDQAPGISPHDCLGSNLNVHTRYGKVMRVVVRENNAINESWISDRDRFSYTGLHHEERIGAPLARLQGKWQVVDWQTAFNIIATRLQSTLNEFGADSFGALASPNSTLEEFYLLQKIVRGLGSKNIDHRLREVDTRDQATMPLFPGMKTSLTELEQCDAIFLIGANIQKEQPLAALRLRKAVKNKAVILAVNPMDYLFNFIVTAKEIVAPHLIPAALAKIVTALEQNSDHAIAQQLQSKQKISILVGALAQHHPEAATIRYLAGKIARLTNGTVSIMTDGANTAGAWLTGAIPHRLVGGVPAKSGGLSASEMLAKPLNAYLMLNVEPDVDCANSAQAIEALKQAKLVVALSMYRNPILMEHADVILPVGAFTETSGTYINGAGEWQSFPGVAKAFESARPAWKVLRVLGNFLHLEGFQQESSEEVKEEVKTLMEKNAGFSSAHQEIFEVNVNDLSAQRNLASNTLFRIGEIPIYSLDSLVRRSKPLQVIQTIMEGDVSAIRLHPSTASALHLQAGEMANIKMAKAKQLTASLPVLIDTRVPEGAAWIAGGIVATVGLGDLFGEVEIGK